jgi:hypothetical protein
MIDEIKRIAKIKKERNMSLKIGNGRSKPRFNRTYFTLKDGEQAYRILPGVGDLAESNRWSFYWNVHYGYKTPDGKKIPFASPEFKKNKVVEVPDVAKDRLEMLKSELEKATIAENKPAMEKLHLLLGYYDTSAKKMVNGVYNLDSKHYMNAIDAQGNIGILKIGHKAKLALEVEISRLEKEGVYPLSPDDGRYFVFKRSGNGRDTNVKVDVLKEKITLDEATAKSLGKKVGSTVENDLVHVLDDGIIARMETEVAQLDKLFKRPTAEEVKRIVDTSDLMTGTSSYLAELFGGGRANEEPQAEAASAEPAAPVVVAPVSVAPVVETPAPVVVKAGLHPARAAETTKAGPKPLAVAKTGPKPVTSLENMDSDAFLAALEAGTI